MTDRAQECADAFRPLDNTVDRIKDVVLAAMRYVDADEAWEGNPSRFLQDHKAAAEQARVAREELKDAVRGYRQALRLKAKDAKEQPTSEQGE